MDLFDNYHPDTDVTEKWDAKDLREQDTFLDAVFSTQVLKVAHQFLSSKGNYYNSTLKPSRVN